MNGIGIGRRIKEFRESRGISISHIAEQLDINRSHLNRIEGGHVKDPSFTLIAKVAEFFEISIDELTDQNSSRKYLQENELPPETTVGEILMFAGNLCEWAEIAIKEGRIDNALSLLTDAIEMKPNDNHFLASLYCTRGDAWYHETEYNRAISDFTLAIMECPEYARSYFRRAEVYAIVGDKVKSLEDMYTYYKVINANTD